MTQQQRDQSQNDETQSQAMAVGNARQYVPIKHPSETNEDTTMPPTNDAGDAISEGSLYDASGAATGGGVDTPDAVEQSTEEFQ